MISIIVEHLLGWSVNHLLLKGMIINTLRNCLVVLMINFCMVNCPGLLNNSKKHLSKKYSSKKHLTIVLKHKNWRKSSSKISFLGTHWGIKININHPSPLRNWNLSWKLKRMLWECKLQLVTSQSLNQIWVFVRWEFRLVKIQKSKIHFTKVNGK